MQTLLLVSHTHWDREWYLTFEEYRTRLAATYDELLDVLETVPEFHSFAFDGQTAPAEDYLEVRPEARERLRAQVRARRLFVGPLYVIPDGYAPTGETWVRNLLLGIERCVDLGGEPGYVYMAEPTSVPEQYPQIMRRFGFDSVVFGRGLMIDQRDGSSPRVADGEYYWAGADGSRILVVHMPAAYDDGGGSRCILHYCNAAEVFWTPEYDPLREQPRSVDAASLEGALERIRILREHLTPIATCDMLLLMHGCDHLPPQRDTPDIIATLNARLNGAKLVHGTFSDYLDAVKRAGRAHVVRQGESRGRGGAMSRVWMRRLDSDAQTLLARWMEPATALASRYASGRPLAERIGGNDLGVADDPGLRKQAWRYLIQNHAHDTIWGACVDEVYDELRVRYAKSRQIAEELAGQALARLATMVDTTSVDATSVDATSVDAASLPHGAAARPYVAFSTSADEREEVAEAEFWLPPDAAGTHLTVVDDSGSRWPAQVIEARRAVRRTERHSRTARVEPVMAVRALVRTAPLPPMGYRAVSVSMADEAPATNLACGPTWLENDHLRVDVRADGTFDVTNRATGRTWRGLNRLVDQGDAGNGWRWNRVAHDRFVDTSRAPGTIALVERGPVRATIEVRIPWRLPDGLTADRTRRARRTRVCPLVVRVSLLAGSPRVHVRTTIDNRARNHRLRAHFPTGIHATVTQADGAFAVHERPIYLTDGRPAEKRTGIGYHPSAPEETAMMHSWVDVSDGRDGVAILTRGVPLYEVQKDDAGAVVFALTLMRAAVGHTVIHDPDLTHGAQVPGEQAAEYAILVHRGDWLAGDVHRQAESFLAPPRFVPTTRHDGPWPASGGWLDPLPPEIALTAVKRSEDGRAIIVRLVNLLREPREATVTFRSRPRSVARANLREEPEAALDVAPDGAVRVSFAPVEIVTLRVE